MIIKESNRARIEEEIRNAEGRATARTITYKNIVDEIERIENELRIPKKYMVGIQASVDVNAQNFPRSYKYTPESTHFLMERTTTGWDLITVMRDSTRTAGHRAKLFLPDEAKQQIINRLTDF